MIARLRPLLRRLRRAFRREDGSASLEFVILFPMFVTILISSVETGVILTRQVMLERALDITVRDMRLGRAVPSGEALSREDIRDLICAYSPMVSDCRANLMIELRPVDINAVAALTGPITCVERGEDVQPATQFQTGIENELMLVRGCALVDPMFPTAGFALNLPRDATGAFALVAQSVFVNEPR